MTAAQDRPVLRPRRHLDPVPYTLTAAGRAALAAWPANRIEHEPSGGRWPCDGRGCRCLVRREGS